MKQDKQKKPVNTLSDQIDSAQDRKEMKPETGSLDLPDASEIEGNRGIGSRPPVATVSSSDEEGGDVFNEENPDSGGSNVSEEEQDDLRTAANDMPGDDETLREAGLDDEDEDGTRLNEDSFEENISPDDLDVPGTGLDDSDENIGEEDEENNEYSLGGDDHEDARRDDD